MLVHPQFNPIALQLGPLAIHWYGLMYLAGFMAFLWLGRKRIAALNHPRVNNKLLDDLLFYGVLGVILGGRLGYVFFYKASYYLSHPLELFAVWQGGMAFHGGFIGLVAAGLYFARRKKIPFYDLADLAVIPAALALGFGRIANFINGEFYGTPTSLPWGVKFGNVEGFRHPVQLYEAAKNFFVFGVLWLLQGRALPKGFLFWLFVFLYGSIRFVLEFLKDDFAVPDYALGMTWGQVWSIPMVLLGGYMLLRLRKGLKAGQGNQQP